MNIETTKVKSFTCTTCFDIKLWIFLKPCIYVLLTANSDNFLEEYILPNIITETQFAYCEEENEFLYNLERNSGIYEFETVVVLALW